MGAAGGSAVGAAVGAVMDWHCFCLYSQPAVFLHLPFLSPAHASPAAWVGASVGLAVGAAVGAADWSAMGAAVGAAVVALVGAAVVALVGLAVGLAVGAAVGSAGGSALDLHLSFFHLQPSTSFLHESLLVLSLHDPPVDVDWHCFCLYSQPAVFLHLPFLSPAHASPAAVD